jgi:protein-disulfide isomerase
MRSMFLVLCGLLVALGVFVAAGATSPQRLAMSSAPVDPSADKAALGRSIREYLLANPEVLMDAMQELERRQDTQRDAVALKAIDKNQEQLLRDPDAPFIGNPNGDVTIVEFTDYQCPYCKRVYAVLKSAVAADGKLKLVYKDLPILGEASKVAAVAALASVKQGKHDPFHNALMEFNGRLDSDRIYEIARSVGIDVALLKKDMEDPKIKQLIERNLDLASELGVRGTPAFVIGKQFVPGAVDAESLRHYIDDARKG